MEHRRMTMNVQELANYLGVSKPTAYDLTRRDDFPSIRIGKRIIVPTEAFNEWLNRSATSSSKT